MKKIISLLLITASVMSINASALDKNRIAKTGVVTLDMYEVTNKAKVYQNIIQQLEKKSNLLNKKAQEKGEELEKAFAELQKLKQTLSDKAYNKKTEDFAVKEAEIKRSLSIEQNKIINAKEQSFHEINKITENILEDLSKEYEFDIVIPAENTLFDTERVDISPEVINKLDSKIKQYDIKFE